MNTKKSAKKNDTAVNYEVEVIRAHQFEDGSIVFDMTINGVTIYGNRLVEGKNGQFVSFPSRKGKDGQYYSHAFAKLSKEDTDKIVAQIEEM